MLSERDMKVGVKVVGTFTDDEQYVGKIIKIKTKAPNGRKLKRGPEAIIHFPEIGRNVSHRRFDLGSLNVYKKLKPSKFRKFFLEWLTSAECPFPYDDAEKEKDEVTGDDSLIFSWNGKRDAHVILWVDGNGYVDMQFSNNEQVGLEFMITLNSYRNERAARKAVEAFRILYNQAENNCVVFTDYEEMQKELEKEE